MEVRGRDITINSPFRVDATNFNLGSIVVDLMSLRDEPVRVDKPSSNTRCLLSHTNLVLPRILLSFSVHNINLWIVLKKWASSYWHFKRFSSKARIIQYLSWIEDSRKIIELLRFSTISWSYPRSTSFSERVCANTLHHIQEQLHTFLKELFGHFDHKRG